jgi:putative DNA primase/helicase
VLQKNFGHGARDASMGYWKAWLVPDPAACILSTELLQVFNAWLAANGHLPWSKETFGPRFKQHDETTRHGVRLAKISKLESLSRPPWPLAVSEVPRRPDAYLGVRFRSVTEAEGITETETTSD